MRTMILLAILLSIVGCENSIGNSEADLIYEEVLRNGLKNEFLTEDRNALLVEDSTIIVSGYYSKLISRYKAEDKNEEAVLNLLLKENQKVALNIKLNSAILGLQVLNESNNSIEENKTAGVVGLSKIYFNETKDFCVVYLKFYCGGECGSGKLIFLQRINDTWKVNKIHTLYIS